MATVKTHEELITKVELDFTELWQNDPEQFGMVLLKLTNMKSNVMDVLGFRTFEGTNRLVIYLDYVNKQEAKEDWEDLGMDIVNIEIVKASFVEELDFDTEHVFVKELL